MKKAFFETKCRRCGTTEEWFFGEFENVPEPGFYESMNNKLVYPPLCFCKQCGKPTIQDLVSYGSEEIETKS